MMNYPRAPRLAPQENAPHIFPPSGCPRFSCPSCQGTEYEAGADDPNVGLGDERIREADQQSDESPTEGGMHRKRDVGAQDADGKATGKRLEQHGCRSIWMIQHHQHIDDTERNTQQDSEDEAIHLPTSTPLSGRLAIRNPLGNGSRPPSTE